MKFMSIFIILLLSLTPFGFINEIPKSHGEVILVAWFFCVASWVKGFNFFMDECRSQNKKLSVAFLEFVFAPILIAYYGVVSIFETVVKKNQTSGIGSSKMVELQKGKG